MVRLSVIQSAFNEKPSENNQKIIHFLTEAKREGAEIVLPPELYQSHYFCKKQDDRHFESAHEIHNHPFLQEVERVAKSLSLVIPCSFFEKDGPHYYNSLAMIDADGTCLGVYRKSHIPDGPGYQEKYYFRPGNTGFKVFITKYGKVGAAICWDQWFPEAARIMTLMGAEILLYPTAIGSEPHAPWLNTKEPWMRVMKGHAVANMIPIAAANRIGQEEDQRFYGSSFVCDEFGEELLRFEQEEAVKTIDVDLNKASHNRSSFGFFRDRRVDLYGPLLT
jgi:N-carbamoylputrescine amidase